MKKRIFLVVLLIFAAIILSGCAAKNPMTNVPLEDSGRVCGFLAGLWDGLIAIPAFIINLFAGKQGSFYNVFNNGGWYNFGFLLGIGAFSGSSTKVISSRRR